ERSDTWILTARGTERCNTGTLFQSADAEFTWETAGRGTTVLIPGRIQVLEFIRSGASLMGWERALQGRGLTLGVVRGTTQVVSVSPFRGYGFLATRWQFMAREKVVLAYSGGLDTSVLVRILTDDYGLDVIAAHVDVGEAKSPEQLKARAKKAGAVAVEFV